MLDDLRIIIRNGIHVVQSEIVGVICVLLCFVAAEKTPAAVKIVIWGLAIHKTDRHTVYRNAIRCEARTAP